MNRNCCKKGVLLPDPQLTPARTLATAEGVDFSKLPIFNVGMSQSLPSSVTAGRAALWEPFRVPPPTDLITALQRLTI